MKEFFKSYHEEVFKPSFKWSKEHWKGLVVLYGVVYTVEMGIIFRDQIKEKIQEKIESKKKNKEEI